MASKIVIAELELDTKSLQKSNVSLIQQITKLKEEQKSLKKETGNLSNATGQQARKFIETEATLKKLSGQYTGNKRILAENQTGVKNLNNELSKETQNITQAREQNKKLLAVRNQVNTKTKAGRDAISQINEKVEKNNGYIKKNVSGLEQQKIGIGDYEGALRRVFPQLNGVIGGVKSFKDGLIAKKTALKASTTTLSRTSKALKIFKLALISTGIGAIVVILGSLISYLSTTQKGIDTVTKITKPLQVIFSRLQGVLQVLGEKMFNTFSNPKQAVKALWEAIKKNIVNRITGIADTFKFLGKTIKAVLTLNFSEAKENAKALGESVTQTLTGVDDLSNKIKKGAKQTAEFLKESVRIGKQLRQIGIDTETKESKIQTIRAKSLDSIKEQELIAKDTTKTVIERKAAVDEALRISRKLVHSEKEIIRLKIKQEEIQQSLNDSGRKDSEKLDGLKAKLISIDTAQKATELRFLGSKTAIQKEQQAAVKKAVDTAIKDSKTLLDIFVAEQGVKAKNIKRRTRLSRTSKSKKDKNS